VSGPSATDAALEARLAEIDGPKGHLFEVRDESLIGRVYASPWLHRSVPWPVGARLASLRGRLDWLRSGMRERALHWAANSTPADTPEDEIRRLARAALRDDAIKNEAVWRPWLARTVRIDGLERLDEARSTGRGIIIATAHIGPMSTLNHAVAAQGIRFYCVRGQALEETRVLRGYLGRRKKAQVCATEASGCRWLGAGGSYAVIREILSRGDACWLAIDVAGDVETAYAGLRVKLRTGISRVAFDAHALIVPAFPLLDGVRQRVLALEPLDPESFEGPDALHVRLAEVIGDVVSAHVVQTYPRPVDPGRSKRVHA
jgi:lauroyl/myristoyl acyltransferase